MASRVQILNRKNLIHPPKWLPQNIHYEVMTGSTSYAVDSDLSDIDISGFCIPPKEMLFPHLAGEIVGFGTQKKRFNVWEEHHIQDGRQEYDFSIYSIVKFFQLVMENNPNMIDILYSPQRCVLFCSPIGQLVRDNRKIFLHKGSYQKLRGYSYSQLHKIRTKVDSSNPKRQESIEKYGYDVKYAMHVIRLLLQAEQILMEHDLDIQRNSKILKSVRCGEWSLEKIFEWFEEREKHLEELYVKSTLQAKPDEDKIKDLLMTCLEQHYGSLDKAVKRETSAKKLVSELKKVIEKYS